MNTKHLILTDIKDMTRAEWLEWRQPVNHVKDFLFAHYCQKNGLYEDVANMKGPYLNTLLTPTNFDLLQRIFESPEWKAFLFPCVGGSEVGTILGLSPYKSVIEMFYEKVGLKDGYFEDNAATFWGKTLEDTIADKWQYWEGSPESMIQNCNQGKIVRKCRKLNYYVQHKDCPWLFASLDRLINKYAGKGEGSLECKTMNGYVAKMWENGIPPMYVAQMQEQLICTGLEFAEMAVLVDGRDFQVYPFNQHPDIQARIIEESKKFHDMVKKGIECFLLWKASGDEKWLVELDRYSPEPDGSLSYESFLNKQWKESGYEKAGGAVELHLAKAYKHFAAVQKDLEAKQRECSNKLKAFLKDGAKIDFAGAGTVTWKADSRGIRTMRVNVKVEDDFRPDPDLIKTEPLTPTGADDVPRQNVPRDTVSQGNAEAPVREIPQKSSTLPPGWE